MEGKEQKLDETRYLNLIEMAIFWVEKERVGEKWFDIRWDEGLEQLASWVREGKLQSK